MRRLTLAFWPLLCALFLAPSVHAQDISGVWVRVPGQGDAPVFRPPRNMAATAVNGPFDPTADSAAEGVADTLEITVARDQLTIARPEHAFGQSRTVIPDGVFRALSGESGRIRGLRDLATAQVEQVQTVVLPDGRVVTARLVEQFSVDTEGFLRVERRSEIDAKVRTWRFVYRRAQ